MTTVHSVRPCWYTDEDDTAWAKLKAAISRDWKQTIHDFGGNEPNLNQQVGDTLSQAAGAAPIPPGNAKTPHSKDGHLDAYNDDDEPAYRYGYAASRHFQTDWDETTESMLEKAWATTDWEQRREAIRCGWILGKDQKRGSCAK